MVALGGRSGRQDPDAVAITGVGMCTPLGGARQSCAAVRGGITRMRELPGLYTCLPNTPEMEEREPVVASAVYHLDTKHRDETRVAEWLALLAAHAYLDLPEGAKPPPKHDATVGLFVSLPPPRAGWGPESRSSFVYHFHNFAGRDVLPFEQHIFVGHCGALQLVDEACSMLRQRALRFALVAGVDSYLFPQWLEPLDVDCRIRSSRGLDGFTPGEAAAVLALEPAEQASARGVELLAGVAGSAAGRYAGPAEANPGAVLGDTLSSLGAAQPRNPVVVCDLNGERSRMREWAFALSRMATWLQSPFALEHPAAALGDVGAASGALLAGLAVSYLKTKYPEAPSALVWTGGDDGERRALLLSRSVPS